MKLCKKLGALIGVLLISILSFLPLVHTQAVPQDPWFSSFKELANKLLIETTGNGLADNQELAPDPAKVTTSPDGSIHYYSFRKASTLYAPDRVDADDKSKPKGQCTIEFEIIVADTGPGNGRAYVKAGAPAAFSSDTISPCSTADFNEAKRKFDQKDTALANSQIFTKFIQQGGGQLADMTGVSVNVRVQTDIASSDHTTEIDPAKAPQNDTLTLTDLAGAVLRTITVKANILPPAADGPATLSYQGSFDSVPAGTYKVCSQVLKGKCSEPFRKETNANISIEIRGDDSNQLAVAKASSGTADEDATCELTGGNPASWILCPAINGAAAMADWLLEQFIRPFLERVPLTLDSASASFKAWSGFRLIANMMLVGILLIAVISQAVGKE
jgi:hypothetical protein